MNRRDVLLLAGGAAALALPARAQTAAMPVIGYLCPQSPTLFASRLQAFRKGLAESGFLEGRDFVIDYRWAEGDYDRLPALAAELASRKVAVIVAAGGAPVALAARAATSTVTIVFEMGGDPVQLGIVDSLGLPGGNITGVSSLSVEVSRKRLEFMRELIPNASHFAIAVNPTSPTATSQVANLHAAAEKLGVGVHVLRASREEEFDAVFAAAAQLGAGGLVFTSDPYFAFRSDQLAASAVRHAMPAVTQSRDFPLAGGLMSYGGDFTQSHRRAGGYVGQILNGAKPTDLPVQLVTKVELFVNVKAAEKLGLVFPPSIISGADDVVE